MGVCHPSVLSKAFSILKPQTVSSVTYVLFQDMKCRAINIAIHKTLPIKKSKTQFFILVIIQAIVQQLTAIIQIKNPQIGKIYHIFKVSTSILKK